MRAVPLGWLPTSFTDEYATMNANATHPNINAILSSQCIAWAAHFCLVEKEQPEGLIQYCASQIDLNEAYQAYFEQMSLLPTDEELIALDSERLCGPPPLEAPYFLPGNC